MSSMSHGRRHPGSRLEHSGPDETRAELILGEDFVCADARVSISASKHSYASPGTEVSLEWGLGRPTQNFP